VIKILQGRAVTQTAQRGLITHSLVANFLQYTATKNYENPSTYFKDITEDKLGLFLETTCSIKLYDRQHADFKVSTPAAILTEKPKQSY